MAPQNRTLGRFYLDGIPPAPRGIPKIEVTFDIDANGIVNVSAKDMATGRSQKITITSSSGLSKEEVDRMKREAEKNEDDDKRKREVIEMKNRADNMCYNIEKTVRENRATIGEDDARRVEEAVKACREAMAAEDAGRIQEKMNALEKTFHKVAEQLYRRSSASYEGAAQGAPQTPPAEEKAPGGGNGGGGKEGDVIDADFEETSR